MKRLLLTGILLAGCPSVTPQPPAGTDEVEAPSCPTEASPETVRIFQGLEPHCVGCHRSGPRGYFASEASFQSLLVADPRYVTPGDPQGSLLVQLLLGVSTGSFSQMPIAGPPYAELAGTAVSIEEISAWIEQLPAQARSSAPDPAASRIVRLSATQVRASLYQQLGLSDEDFFSPAHEFDVIMAHVNDDDSYPMLSPDATPAPRQRGTEERHLGLGGASVLQQTRADASASPNFVNHLVQTAQRWCALALQKSGNTALFADGAASLNEEPTAVKDTLRRWSRQFHAVALTDAEADDLYNTVFLPLRGGEDADLMSAWAGTCSYFIRHPNWIFY